MAMRPAVRFFIAVPALRYKVARLAVGLTSRRFGS
jgi:hypothetical protein